MYALEYRHDFGGNAYGKAFNCAPAFNFVSAPLSGAAIECRSWKYVQVRFLPFQGKQHSDPYEQKKRSYITSHRCCKTFTGCSLRNASISCWLCSFTDACTVCRHGIFPTTSRASPTPTAAVFGRRHPRSWWFDVHGCPPSAIEHFRWLVAASGTVCRLTLPHLQRWLFFGIASKLSFSPNHFLTNCFPFLVLYAVYCSGLAVLYLGHSK